MRDTLKIAIAQMTAARSHKANIAAIERIARDAADAGSWGLSICYDLRFPHHYRSYAQANARMVFVPAQVSRH